ncbi:P27 family phage terminase small subunit [Ruminiclostridium herbifermentans]|uniref:P27 family phage terminase small subunit n=1 Tax=Ruminiclostridium herbifermentans TaxID=2488810 RepID=A0A4U7JDP0_9FIRM|nr:P27 family phage terminase small subunit [Ruminiclostridium herbifermentans]QNU66925.1 P27 family phage terminase small subunit [Ruminiclostridium herbifermentans]
MASAKKIKDSLIKQLKDKGANVEHFSSLIDDYIWYWIQEKNMQKDIKKRGQTYIAISAAGKEYEKDNPSVKNALMYNKQKLAILKELGLTTSNVKAGDGDDEL